MVKRIGGFRRKTRHKLSRSISEKGKIFISRFLQNFDNGTKVVLKADPSVQKGMYYPRFHGKIGVVKSKRGNSYEVEIKDTNKVKTMFVHAVHLKRV